MELSTNWIKDYVDLDGVDLNDLAKEISLAGINIPIVKKQVDATKLVIGHVLECEMHPNSDHLHLCKVDVGSEVLQIICGAKNIDKGQKVVVSLPGATLPGGIEITKSTIRGIESNGMCCALCELGLPDDTDDGIHILPDDAPVGEDALKYMGLDDTIFVTDVKGDRKVDSTNYLGMAYEVGAILSKDVKMPDIDYKEISNDVEKEFKLKVETEKCLSFLGKLVKDIEIKESPMFIKNRLIASGMRPINNVVDISNYVMLEYGQPLHFYDADKLKGNIIVRNAKNKEKTVTLDNNERELNSEDIVIADKDEIVCIAGVMGSLNSEVTDKTKNILVECAIFDGTSIRKTSLKLDLRSEAATRYERGLGYEYNLLAIKRACYLLEKYASGKVCKGMLKHDKIDKKKSVVSVSLDKINTVLGTELTKKEVGEYFNRLKFDYKEEKGVFEVTAPNRRRDINIPEDLIEEVGRLYGFHNLKPIKPFGLIKMGGYEEKTLFRKDISKYMRSMGLNETRTYTLISEKDATKFNFENKKIIELPNPISKERTHIRVSLTPSLLEVYNYNNNRGVNGINIYEISNIYSNEKDYPEEQILSILMSGEYLLNKWEGKVIKSDFYVIKGIVENLFNYLGFEKRYTFNKEKDIKFMHPGITATILVDNDVVGFVGRIHPSINKDEIYVCELNLSKIFNKKTGKIKYKEANKFPTVKRDVAFLFKNDIEVSKVIREINKNGNKILSNVEVFDVYEKQGEKSIGFSLYFESDHTLTDEEINNAFNRIIDAVSKKFSAILRNK